jgi:PPM family protein phosphatase
VLVDVMGLQTKAGDRFLLCSDGLSNLMENEDLGEAMAVDPLDEVAARLIQLANDRGGDDNITVVVVHRVE